MLLSRALRLREREVVSFVGGGGKTTAMFRLAEEIVAAGGRVVTTTTTRIFAAQSRLAPAHFALSPDQTLPPAIDSALDAHGHVLITGSVDEREGKAFGVSPAIVSQLAARPDLSAILVEADGSRMRPLKAPADHEPVIPAVTTLVVSVAGADALGQPLDETHTHRPGLIRRVVGAEAGQVITPEIVAALLAHRDGGRKNVPAKARVVALINKVEDTVRLSRAREIADRLVRRHGFDSALLGAVARPETIVEARSRTAAVVLAAGEAKRMGRLKQLLPWGNTTLVGHAADTALASQADEVLVVVGCQAGRVAQAVADRPVRVVVNPDWAEGQSTSVRAGIAALAPGAQAAIFLLADQPQIGAEVIDAVIQRHRETLAPIVAPRVGDRRANPVLFDRTAWPELAAVTGDTGGRPLFVSYADRIEWVQWGEAILDDLDTPEDFERAGQTKIKPE